jgi:hypothetical protein
MNGRYLVVRTNLMDYERRTVLNIGSIELESKPFTERGLNLVKVVLQDSQKWFNNSRAIVIADPPLRMGFLRTCIESLKPVAEDYGLSFIIIAQSSDHFHQISKYWQELKISDEPRIYLPNDLGYAAEYIVRKETGPPLGKTKIQTSGFKVSPRIKHLLQRAFYDCEKIHLEKLGGGRNSLNVYSVDAWLVRSRVGPRPLPFFIKIADPEIIKHELLNYDCYAELYIPFHLRPNVVQKRCVTIRGLSAIVGNLVDEAMPLRQALRSGHGAGALFTLFETSLKGFRFQPSTGGQIPRSMNLADFVKGKIRANEIKPHVVKRAQQEFGLSMRPTVMEDSLLQQAKSLPNCLAGPYHGDLHPANVLIRGRDAILIDFSSASDGPLTADPAALEVSLLFGTDKDDNSKYFANWIDFIDDIYCTTDLTLRPPALQESEPGHFSWLRKPLRELRHILLGCDCDVRESEIVLATYLMRYARLGIEFIPSNLNKLALDRHAYALVIAERIVKRLSSDSVAEGDP